MFRPRVRLPWWAAVAIVVTALVAGKLLRGDPLSVTRSDALVLLVVALGIGIALYLRAGAQREPDDVADERDAEGDGGR